MVLLILVCALGWFNRIGLPDFLKRRLVETLQSQGIDLAFTRMRLHLVHGLIIENVRIGHAATPDDPVFSLAEIQLQLNYPALWHRQWKIDGLVLRDGRLIWPVTPTNSLALDKIQAELRFQPNATWSLDHFQADLDGAQILVSGDIVHAPELRRWDIFQFHGKKTADRTLWQARLRQFADVLNRVRFTGSQASLTVDGDARDIRSFDVRLNLNVPAVQTAWGDAQNVQFNANLTAPGDPAGPAESALGAWTNAWPYRLTWTARLARLKSERLNLDSLEGSGRWQAPELAITRLSAELGGGPLNGAARLNVIDRKFTFTGTSGFDLHAVAALLTDKTRERLAEFSWTQPPSLQASGSLVLPAWTNRQPDWRADVQPTVQLNGELTLGNTIALGAELDWAHTHFAYSNLVWSLPDLAIVKSKTRLSLSGGENDLTRDYRWHIRGRLDAEAVRPFLTASNAVRGFSHFTFSEPLALELDVAGRLYDYDRLSAEGQIALTNFTLRGESVDSVAGQLTYTNRVLEFLHPHLWHGAQSMTADKVTLDFNSRFVRFTNGLSTADPKLVTHAIGPKTGRLMDPYQFLQPPTVCVNGCIPLRDMNGPEDTEGADLRFDIIEGAPFQWMKFKTPNITGTIRWLGSQLVLTNVQAAFYGGGGNGHAYFDFRVPHEGAEYDLTMTVTNADLHALANDLISPTNRLEGVLGGKLIVTRADSRDWRTWNGYGRVNLHNGLLWDIPIFGILSPVLNTFSSGLGNSRATDAAARFSTTNGMIYSDSLNIRSTMMQLDYTGTMDMQENVNARVTARLLRNTWGIGPVVSTMLWPVSKLFEFHVTGTLKNPKSEPMYVPKLLLLPLHPIRTLEEMVPGGDSLSNPPPDSNGSPAGQ